MAKQDDVKAILSEVEQIKKQVQKGEWGAYEYETFVKYFIFRNGAMLFCDANVHDNNIASKKTSRIIHHNEGKKEPKCWPIYDDGFCLTTINPKQWSSTWPRGALIATCRQMIEMAANRDWKTVGVSGCDRELAYVLMLEYNQQHPQKQLQFQDSEFFNELNNIIDTQLTPTRRG